MENASKALIIAGAILLSILLISLGIMIFNQAQDSLDGNGMNQAKITTFNSQFTKYEGTAPEQTQTAKDAISALMFIVPPVLIIISFIVFSKKYKIYGDFKREVLAAVSEKHNKEEK